MTNKIIKPHSSIKKWEKAKKHNTHKKRQEESSEERITRLREAFKRRLQ